MQDEAVRQMVLPNWWLCRRPQGEGVQQARKVIDEYLEECIADRRRQLAAKLAHSSSNNNDNGGESSDSKTTTTDLLNILLEAEASAVMSHDEIKGQLLQFVFAGYDTLAPTLTYMLWEVRVLFTTLCEGRTFTSSFFSQPCFLFNHQSLY